MSKLLTAKEAYEIAIDNKEFVIENIIHVKDYTDSPSSHLALKIRDGGEGNIKR